MDIIDALHSRTVFQPLFKKRETWAAWEVYLQALFGLSLERRTRASGNDLVKHKPGGSNIHMLDARIGQFADRGRRGYMGLEVKACI